MQSIAAWLVARPLHAILGLALTLALTLFLPFAQVFSGAAMITLVLAGGARNAALQGLVAASILGALSLLSGASLPVILVGAAFAWVPALLLASLLRQSRSLTLTMQVSVIVAMLVTLGFYVVIDDPTAFWIVVLEEVANAFSEMGLNEQAALVNSQKDLIAPQMTMLTVLTSWSMMMLITVLGYAVYQELPGKKGEFGRFCDLRFGRVLALVMAISSVLALFVGAEWLRSFAFVVFVIFWLQGLAMMHWLHVVGPLPIFVLIVIYLMLPFLNALLVTALAVVGYTDAWFDYRSRIGKSMAR